MKLPIKLLLLITCCLEISYANPYLVKLNNVYRDFINKKINLGEFNEEIEKIGKDSTPFLLEKLSTEKDYGRQNALLTNLSLNRVTCNEISPLITSALESKSWLVRFNALSLITRSNCHVFSQQITSLIRTEKQSNVLSAAIESLGHLESGENESLIRKFQDDPEEKLSVRLSSSKALALLGMDFNRELLDQALKLEGSGGEVIYAKRTAIMILALIGGHDDTQRLLEISGRDKHLAPYALTGIERIKLRNIPNENDKKSHLLNLVRGDNQSIRYWALKKLTNDYSSPNTINNIKEIAREGGPELGLSISGILLRERAISALERDELLKDINLKPSK